MAETTLQTHKSDWLLASLLLDKNSQKRKLNILFWNFRQIRFFPSAMDTGVGVVGIVTGAFLFKQFLNFYSPKIQVPSPPSSHSSSSSSLPSLPSSSSSYLVYGLHNLGATCFFNSVLQALANIPLFIPYLEFLNSASNSSPSSPSSCLFDPAFVPVLLSTLKKLNQPLDHAASFSPREVIETVCHSQKWDFYALSKTQQDAHELFQALSDMLSELGRDLKQSQRQPSLTDILTPSPMASPGPPPRVRSFYLSEDSKVHYHPFTGVITSRVTCSKCGFTSDHSSTFHCLSLSVPSTTTSTVTLTETLNHFFHQEHISSYRCFRCWLHLAIIQLERYQISSPSPPPSPSPSPSSLLQQVRSAKKWVSSVVDQNSYTEGDDQHQSEVISLLGQVTDADGCVAFSCPKVEHSATKQLFALKWL
eukprot:Lithocolla_globosa_v1_NODE_1288_length_2698_cov_11.370034.p1 type:complete len:420 gc:universal NODE_1288_length_2698_cov_11.370034:258-1517(+)